MYGQTQYGVLQYSTSPDDGQITPHNPDLMRYLPLYWQDVREMQALQQTAGAEVGLQWDAVDDLMQQFFVSTATWGLEWWERELELTTDPSKPVEHRREIILAKLRGASTATPEFIRNVASTFSGTDVRIIEYPTEYRFVVQFVGIYGIPPNMAGLIQAIEDIKPAHLTYSFKYTYTVWSMLRNLTWQQAKTRTWENLRLYEGGSV